MFGPVVVPVVSFLTTNPPASIRPMLLPVSNAMSPSGARVQGIPVRGWGPAQVFPSAFSHVTVSTVAVQSYVTGRRGVPPHGARSGTKTIAFGFFSSVRPLSMTRPLAPIS